MTTQQQIEKKEQELKLLKEKLEKEISELSKNKSQWLKIPELNIEVEIEVHNKGQSWNDLKLSKRENDLLTVQEVIFLVNHPKYSKILKMDGSSSNDDFFIQQPFNLNKNNNYIARFNANSVGAYLYCGGDPSYSNFALGVRWKKILKKVGK